jgi:predicted cupin superfamily sugar epimerase
MNRVKTASIDDPHMIMVVALKENRLLYSLMKLDSDTPESLIKRLKLLPHPEGGFYREVYRSKNIIKTGSKQFPAGRSFYTSIYFLLNGNQVSKLHRIRSDEIWHFNLGAALTILELKRGGGVKKTVLGPQLQKGQVIQYCVPKNTWFGAYLNTESGFALVSCNVSPGFDFRDFEMAKRLKLLKTHASAKASILKLT